ncbi:MAG: CDP-alcohol phosphatidyltransferase family protein [Parcubacteria group bacterium]|nr:CDP-alcohol phosphatidyltransferase family protein [Parcubacteria group bacterium]
MFVGQFKKLTNKIFPDKFLRLLPRIGLTANRLTFLSLLCTLGAAYLFWQGEVVWGGALALLDWIFDMFDGRIARLQQRDNKLGAFFDFFSDRIRLIWLVALAFGSVISFQLAIIALLLDALLFLFSSFVELKKLKHPSWLPANIDLITAGAIVNQIPIFIYIKLVLGSILLVLQVITALAMNRNNQQVKL